jgi:sigma-B regulation protein RsbU (phosphoserine phosphatase)
MLLKVPADREKLVHTFLVNGSAQELHFEFSSRYLTFQGEEMVLLILYDVTTLERQKRELVDKQSKIDESLKAAAVVQHCLLPDHTLDTEHVEFAWKLLPCEEIGGDILNVLPLDETHLGLYVVDVAGHGPPSAMISSLVYQLMNPHTGILLDNSATPSRIRNPVEVLSILDKEFPLARFDHHFTVAYAIVDLASGTMTYSNAAHCYPIVLPCDGGLKTLDVGGTVIGIGAMPFEEDTVRLSPGDKVVFLSDGVEEMQNTDNEFFGEVRLHSTLLALREEPVTGLVQGLYGAVMRFAGDRPPADDLSILAFEYKG